MVTTDMQDAQKRPFIFSDFYAICLIVLFLFPVFLIQIEMYDGMALAYAYETHDLSGIRFGAYAQNWYSIYFIYSTILHTAWFLNVNYLLLVKLFLLIIYCGIYWNYKQIFRNHFCIDAKSAKIIALCASLFPCLQIFSSSLIVNFPFFLMIGLLGYRLIHSSNILFHLVGWGLILLSFQLNSMMTMLIGMHICSAAFRYASSETLNLPKVSKTLAALILACIVHLILNRVVFPPIDVFSSYNALTIPTTQAQIFPILRAVLMFCSWWIIPLSAFAVYCALNQFPQIIYRLPKQQTSDSPKPLAWCLCLISVAAWWFASIFPYVLVAKGSPLFTVTSMGSGITEQAIRGVYSSWFAPTFSTTSGRHALLTTGPLCLASYLFFAAIKDKLTTPVHYSIRRVSRSTALVALLISILPWAWGGAWSRIEQQYAKISLSKGFSQLEKAPAGLVQVRYSPRSDWLMQISDGNHILSKAWGEWNYYGMFYSFDEYMAELKWTYVAGYKNIAAYHETHLKKTIPLANFPDKYCQSKYTADIPSANAFTISLAGIFPSAVEPASIKLVSRFCDANTQVVNPYPNRIMTF